MACCLLAFFYKSDTVALGERYIVFTSLHTFRREGIVFEFSSLGAPHNLRIGGIRIEQKWIFNKKVREHHPFFIEIEARILHWACNHESISKAIKIGIDRGIIIAIEHHAVELRKRHVARRRGYATPGRDACRSELAPCRTCICRGERISCRTCICLCLCGGGYPQHFAWRECERLVAA